MTALPPWSQPTTVEVTAVFEPWSAPSTVTLTADVLFLLTDSGPAARYIVTGP